MNKPNKLTTNQLIKQLTADTIDRTFLISALDYYSHAVLADDTDWANSLVNKDLWRTCAKHTLDTLNQYGGERS